MLATSTDTRANSRSEATTMIMRATLLLLSGLAGAGAAEYTALRIRPDVAAAIKEGRPVVALESTIISHGARHCCSLFCARQ